MGRYNGNDLNGSANARTFNKFKRRAAQQIYTSLEPSQEQAPLSATVTATATEGTGTAHKRSMSYDIHTNGHDLQSNEKLPTLNETGAAPPYYDVTDEKDIHTSNSYNRNSFIDSTISRFISRPETPTLSTRHTEGDTRTWSLPSLSGHFNVSLSDNFKFIILCLMWYSTSAFTNNIGKQILMQFRYPVTLTYVQFGLVSLSCFVLTRITGITQIRKPDMAIIKTVLPLAGFQIVGHVFSSVAISRVPVSLVHTIKALSPLFTVLLYRFLFQVQYASEVYISLLPLTLGVILACSFTFTTNVLGLLCALGSCLVFVLQNVFSKKLLFKESGSHPRRADKLDKLNLLFYSSLLAFILMTPLWFTSDGYVIFGSLASGQALAHGSLTSSVVIAFLLNGTMHFGQNWCAFTTLSLTSPVTYSIASLVKRIFVIVASILWFGQQVSFVQTIGILLTFIGLWMYQSAKQDVDRGESKIREKSLGATLPTSQVERPAFDTNTSNFGWNDLSRSVQGFGGSMFSRIKRQPTPDLGVKSL
ncbi:unnamed protein product [Umbelopsis ramanniana]